MQRSFTTGDTDTAIDIMREAAQWLIDAGKPMWDLDRINREYITNPADEFHMARVDGEGAAACLLSFHDPFFWPDIPPGASGFVHKLAVRRRFAGQGLGEAMLAHSAKCCLARDIPMLRLDTDANRPGLCALYERSGFTQVGIRRIYASFVGKTLDVAMYEAPAAALLA